MSDSRFYALLTSAALVLGLVIVAGPDAEPAGAVPSPAPGTLIAASSTVTSEASTTTSSISVGYATELTPTSVTTTLPRTTTTTPPTTTISAAPKQSGGGGSNRATTTTTTSAPPETSPPTTIQAQFRGDYEATFTTKINGLRSSNGLGTLARNGSLDAEARSWAKTMADSGGLMHSNIGRLVPPWSSAGENVGKGASVGTIFNLLVGSAGHRGNMLGDYTHVGVGVWVDSLGTIWTVHLFTK